jgi:hypothetical protein
MVYCDQLAHEGLLGGCFLGEYFEQIHTRIEQFFIHSSEKAAVGKVVGAV